MYILTGVKLDKIQSSDKGINTSVYNKIDTAFDTIAYFGRLDNESPSFTSEELAKEVKKQSSKKDPLIVRLGNFVWSIIEV